jgi:hypothetical protein
MTVADHLEVKTTQQRYPVRAALRTAVQVGVPTFIVLVGVLPGIIADFLDTVGQHLPEGARLWLAGAATVITAVAAFLARLMAVPAVDRALKALSSSPRI